MSLYHENQAMNGRNPGTFSSWIFGNGGVLGHDCLKMRETILEHESLFRNQLLELHRLYGRQKELMDEVRRRENDRQINHEKFPIVPHACYNGDTELSLFTARRLPCNPISVTLDLVSKGFAQNPLKPTDRENSGSFIWQGNESIQRHLPFSFTEKKSWLDHGCVGEFIPSKSSAFLQSQVAEPRTEQLKCQLSKGEPVSSRTRKLFGVEISEANEASVDVVLGSMSVSNTSVGNDQELNRCPASWISPSFVPKSEPKGAASKCGKNDMSCLGFSFFSDSKDSWSQGGCSSVGSSLFGSLYHRAEVRTDENSDHLKPNNPAESLPWFLRKMKDHDDVTNKGMRSSYFMNLESLQNCTQSFFKKPDPDNMHLKNNIPHAENGNNLTTAMINVSLSSDQNSENELPKGLNTSLSELRHQIDLNLSLDEEDTLPPHHLVKIATTEIDLEAPVVEFDECASKEAELCEEELDRLAAESILAFSMHKGKSSLEAEATDPPEDAPNSDLKWFVELIFSEFHEESVPNSMDHFEFMTLKLEDCKSKHYDYQPVILEAEKERDSSISTKTRRQSRRGKPRKDFQRDILPGLVTLSRVQVSEDLQSFEELMKGQGKSWQSRNSRGRKRTIAAPAMPPKPKPVFESNGAVQQPVWQLKERSLTGWGKRTRRLPRQRCPNGFITFPIKC